MFADTPVWLLFIWFSKPLFKVLVLRGIAVSGLSRPWASTAWPLAPTDTSTSRSKKKSNTAGLLGNAATTEQRHHPRALPSSPISLLLRLRACLRHLHPRLHSRGCWAPAPCHTLQLSSKKHLLQPPQLPLAIPIPLLLPWQYRILQCQLSLGTWEGKSNSNWIWSWPELTKRIWIIWTRSDLIGTGTGNRPTRSVTTNYSCNKRTPVKYSITKIPKLRSINFVKLNTQMEKNSAHNVTCLTAFLNKVIESKRYRQYKHQQMSRWEFLLAYDHWR